MMAAQAQRRWFDKVSRAFLAAVLMAAGVVCKAPRDPEAYITAFGIVAAAVSGGAKKRPNEN